VAEKDNVLPEAREWVPDGERVILDAAGETIESERVPEVPTFPAASMACTVMLWVATERVETVRAKVPSPAATPKSTWVEPSQRVRASDASVVPVMAGVVTVVRLSPGVPVSEAGARVGPAENDGATVSVVMVTPAEAGPSPEVLVAVAVMVEAVLAGMGVVVTV
jgi:hypothetical protein